MTVNTQELRELVAGLPLVGWSKSGSTVEIPETEDFAGKQLPITGLDKQYARRLAAYIAAANPLAVSALLDEIDRLSAALAERDAGWVSVDDRLPGEDDTVLAAHIDGDVEIVFGSLLHETYLDGTYTHWMNMPEPPKGS